MNILCVGNSFAIDAATYVHPIAKSMGFDINTHVLYIGGCPIDLHWKNFLSKAKDYEFYINGQNEPTLYCDIFEGLNYKKWDYITFQQRSGDSVDAKTFFPELTYLMEGIRKYSSAKYLLHETWSYARSFSHERYGSNPMDQNAMDRDIENAYQEVSKITKIPYIIPSGISIKEARKVFGDYLDRDGYHLNERGRIVAALTWIFFFLGLEVDPSSYKPTTIPYDEYLKLIEISRKVVKNNKGHDLW